jgi:predicted nucleic acid-binding protein
MSGDFLDSNVLIYLFDPDPGRRSRAEAVVNAAHEAGGNISFQVVQETLNVMMTKVASPMSLPEARRFLVDTLEPLWTVNPSPALYHRALGLRVRYGYAFYDSLIIAAALEAGCDRLLSEDLQAGQAIEGLTIVNPFAT